MTLSAAPANARGVVLRPQAIWSPGFHLQVSFLPNEASDRHPGKRKNRPLIAAVGCSGTISIKDQLSGKWFLVDSGRMNVYFQQHIRTFFFPGPQTS